VVSVLSESFFEIQRVEEQGSPFALDPHVRLGKLESPRVLAEPAVRMLVSDAEGATPGGGEDADGVCV
jgi:hypothetical protein